MMQAGYKTRRGKRNDVRLIKISSIFEENFENKRPLVRITRRWNGDDNNNNNMELNERGYDLLIGFI
jgi:hypothetical protein